MVSSLEKMIKKVLGINKEAIITTRFYVGKGFICVFLL